MASKKYALRMFGSSVPPDLLDTMHSVVASVTFFSNAAICCGSVLSSTCKVGKPPRLPNVLGQHFRPQARSAHAEQQHVGEPSGLDLVLERLQRRQVLGAVLHDVEPGEPLGFVAAGPDGGLARPQVAQLCRPRASCPAPARPPCSCRRAASWSRWPACCRAWCCAWRQRRPAGRRRPWRTASRRPPPARG